LAAVGEAQFSVKGSAVRQKTEVEVRETANRKGENNEEENAKGSEKGKAVTEKRNELRRFG
jgi:hypothetical protein